MDPQNIFCPNMQCPARGRTGVGNIGIYSHKERRYICHVCGRTFVETKGTPFYRLKTAKDVFTLVVTLLCYGCPVQAIVAAFGLDERTVRDWLERSGRQSQSVHQHLVQKPRQVGQVQADEIRVKEQGKVVWMAMAIMVRSRLWLDGVISEHRNLALTTALMHRVHACSSALYGAILFCTDGLSLYVTAIRKVFRQAVPSGHRGRPELRAWGNICIAQSLKQYAQGRVVGVVRRIIQGSAQQIQSVIEQTQGSGNGVINVAFIERLNATFRQRLYSLVRRGRALARQTESLHWGMYLVGTVYNFCTEHKSLRVRGLVGGHKWLNRTPAMAAGITGHCWSVEELMWFRVPVPAWSAPKRRGRQSRATKLLIARWCT